MTWGVYFFLLFIAFCVAGCAVERAWRKRNRWTRSGWRITRPSIYDASCRSGWQANVQRGHRY